jgi:hypothetical protein
MRCRLGSGLRHGFLFGSLVLIVAWWCRWAQTSGLALRLPARQDVSGQRVWELLPSASPQGLDVGIRPIISQVNISK